ncbi:(2E,6E)-farnesyl diphosphate synthase [Granulosicoccaceae sp. 1_MG-2023]|nr:(2E,6E)-farnesyl diphosphate synthase [Granulosicoccaceae sp. 1_MG-2023]
MEFEARLEAYRQRVDEVMLRHLPTRSAGCTRLKDAMHYAITNGGKRVRPVLVYATGEAIGAKTACMDMAAGAVEMLHAYSLVHDDLPAMDDDDLRRGKPTCHKQFDEATAILAGDALQALAFTLLSHPSPHYDAQTQIRLIRTLGDASGAAGMAEGQAIDLEAVGRQLSLAELENMHRHKTGALIRASVLMGAIAAGETDETLLNKLDSYAAAIGLSFQIVDDVLDITGDTEILGKPQGSDIARDKPTYPALLGLDGAKRHAMKMHEQALAHLQDLPSSFDILRDLSAYIIERSH